MGKIIAIANQKGGVGKTTTAVNLSAALSEAGQKVLVLDFDPQGNASSGFGVEEEDINAAIYDVMIDESKIEEAIIKEVLEGLDLIPSSLDLAATDVEFVEVEDKNLVLRNHILPLKNDYDYILIDCPPSLGTLTVNALAASNSVIIPIQCEYYALEGLGQILNSIDIVKNGLNTGLQIEGILFTMYDVRNRLSQEVVDSVKKNYKGFIFNTLIPRNVRLAEAPSHGMPITSYASSSTGADGYRKLAAELMEKEMS